MQMLMNSLAEPIYRVMQSTRSYQVSKRPLRPEDFLLLRQKDPDFAPALTLTNQFSLKDE